MTIKCVLSLSAGVLSSLFGRFSSIWKFTGEIVMFAPFIVGALFEKSKEYLASRALTTDHMSGLNMTTQCCIMLDNSKYGAFFSVNAEH